MVYIRRPKKIEGGNEVESFSSKGMELDESNRCILWLLCKELNAQLFILGIFLEERNKTKLRVGKKLVTGAVVQLCGCRY